MIYGKLRGIIFGHNDACNRSRLLRLSIITSLSGKGVSIVTQLIALPIAISALGLARYGLYAMLTSFLVWVNTASVLISSGLTVQIVNANSADDKVRQRVAFMSSLMLAFAISIVVSLSISIALHCGVFDKLFGVTSASMSKELSDGIKILALFASSSILFGIAEAAQAGYQKQYINNMLLSVSNIITIILLVLVIKNWPSVPNMIMAIYGPQLLVRIINACVLIAQHPHLLSREHGFSFGMLNNIVRTGGSFSLTQIGAFIYQNFTVYWVGLHVGMEAAAYMAVMMLITALSGSLLQIFTQPLWPAVQDAVSRNDRTWIAQTYKLTLLRLVPYVTVAALIIGLFGNVLIQFWTKKSSELNQIDIALWALYFFFVAWEHINYTFIIGIGKFLLGAGAYLIGASFVLISSVLFVEWYGMSAVLASMSVGPVIISAWMLPKVMYKFLNINSPISTKWEEKS